MPTGDAVGGFLSGLASGYAAKKDRAAEKERDTGLEQLNQKIGRAEMGPDFVGPIRPLGSKRKGGRIDKTGAYILHEGEEVIPAGRNKSRKVARSTSRSTGRR